MELKDYIKKQINEHISFINSLQDPLMNGILHCRYIHNGEWIELSKEALTERIVKIEEKLKEAYS